jgi:hypothetical protein
MGINYCKGEEPDLDQFEEDRSEKKTSQAEAPSPPPPPPKKKELEVITFDLHNQISENPEWTPNIWGAVKIVETPGKGFRDFATSRVKTEGKEQVLLGELGTLTQGAQEGEYSIGHKNQFMSQRLMVEKGKFGLYNVNGIDNVQLNGDLTVLCNVDFEDLFPEDLIKEIQKLDYSKKVYANIKDKLFHKNFLFR